MENKLTQILKDINDENCVVIIGPDICDFGKPFFEYMSDELFKNDQNKDVLENSAPYVFLNEELFQLKPEVKEASVITLMEDFYESQTVFETPLRKISQIPFHLIISLMPDERLRKIFLRQKLPFNFEYYPTEYSFKPILEKPTKEKPLIYNLLGDFKKTDAVITFDTFFSFLSGIMGKRELPEIVLESLQRARTILFLGVHFERWHVQLLMKLITPQRKLSYSILKNGNSNDVCLFIGRRLSLQFLGNDPLEFLDGIFQKCKEQGLLKSVTVFLSYSHADMEIVKSIASILRSFNIQVIQDEDNMPGGKKINDFVASIDTVDFVLPILSKHSLFSPWVIKEISTCFALKKKLIPYCIDGTLFDKNINKMVTDLVKTKTDEIIEKMKLNADGNIADLVTEQALWSKYKADFPTVLDEVKNEVKSPLMDLNNLNSFIHDIVLRDLGVLKEN